MSASLNTPTVKQGGGYGTSGGGGSSVSSQSQYIPASTPEEIEAKKRADAIAANQGDVAAAMAILNEYLNNGTIDNGTYQMFKAAVEAWNPDMPVDYANILNTFDTIRKEDIDPYFEEQIKIFTDDLQNNREFLNQMRGLETEQEMIQRDKAIEGTQADLERRGMTFTGEAVKKLGEGSAFTANGVDGSPRFGGVLPEGEVQQASRIASSSSALRYQKTLRDLQRQAETTLGSDGSSGLIPGVPQLGGVTGTMPIQKKQALGSTLTGLYNQQMNNVGAQEQVKVFNEI